MLNPSRDKTEGGRSAYYMTLDLSYEEGGS